jgi:hypothetical protein
MKPCTFKVTGFATRRPQPTLFSNTRAGLHAHSRLLALLPDDLSLHYFLTQEQVSMHTAERDITANLIHRSVAASQRLMCIFSLPLLEMKLVIYNFVAML